jgi:hypothetical protein
MAKVVQHVAAESQVEVVQVLTGHDRASNVKELPGIFDILMVPVVAQWNQFKIL